MKNSTTEDTENTESDTPETDKAFKYWPSENAELVDANFARKLERERDEANGELHGQFIRYDALFDEAEKIRMERDEARAEVEKLRESFRSLLNPQCGVEEAAK